MNEFCQLYAALDETTRTSEKVHQLKRYLAQASPRDASWAIYFLIGNRLRRLIKTGLLRKWAAEVAGISDWLFQESYDRVGDLAETIALLLPGGGSASGETLADLLEQRLIPLRGMTEEEQQRHVVEIWNHHSRWENFVIGKLLTGGFRVGVSRKLVVRALAEHTKVDAGLLTRRLMGDWEPSAGFYEALIEPDEKEARIGQPYPFFLANPLKETPEELGEPDAWWPEWKWDGIRAQVIRRRAETFIWSRGEELVTDQFPEIAACAADLPDGTVLDGEILAWDVASNRPLEFHQLQRRLGRKRVGAKLLKEVPVVMLAFDLLEHQSADIRQHPLIDRQVVLRKVLRALQPAMTPEAEVLFANAAEPASHPELAIRQPPPVVKVSVARRSAPSWSDLADARSRAKSMRAEGLMLKRLDSTYQAGRPVGDWWKWKTEPYTIDAVLVYAQRGHGRRAGLYTDYTFAIWHGEELVPFAKAYSGLTDKELNEVDRFIRRHTNEKFGPVRSVTPELVFELAFENIRRSPRHKSGIAVRFPRITRWRQDKRPRDADRLETILSWLEP